MNLNKTRLIGKLTFEMSLLGRRYNHSCILGSDRAFKVSSFWFIMLSQSPEILCNALIPWSRKSNSDRNFSSSRSHGFPACLSLSSISLCESPRDYIRFWVSTSRSDLTFLTCLSRSYCGVCSPSVSMVLVSSSAKFSISIFSVMWWWQLRMQFLELI